MEPENGTPDLQGETLMAMNADTEKAAIYSLASLATEFSLQPAILPTFLAWASRKTTTPFCADNPDNVAALRHLAGHLETMAEQMVAIAMNKGGNPN